MNNRLEGEETYKDIDRESDVIRLLLIIKSISYSYKSKSYPILTIHMVLRKFYLSYQPSSSLCDKYFDTMTNLRDIISHCGGVIENYPFLEDKFMKAADPADRDNPTKTRRLQLRLQQKRPTWPLFSYQALIDPDTGCYSIIFTTPSAWDATNIQRR